MTLIIVTTRHSSLNVERVRRRVLVGGHDVPADRIIARHRRCTQLLPRAIETVDEAWIFDSTDRTRLVAAFRDGAVVRQKQLPRYMTSTLFRRLRERKSERAATELPAYTVLNSADELAGEYQGFVTWSGRHYLLQDCAGLGAVLHDRCMLIGKAKEAEPALIAYREGSGTVAHFSG